MACVPSYEAPQWNLNARPPFLRHYTEKGEAPSPCPGQGVSQIGGIIVIGSGGPGQGRAPLGVMPSLLFLCTQVIHGLSTLCVRRVAWETRTLVSRRGRSSFSACCAFRWRHVRRAATWACGALPNHRSGRGRHGSKSEATSAADAWALSRARRKPQWSEHGQCPVGWKLCRVRGSRRRAVQVLLRACELPFRPILVCSSHNHCPHCVYDRLVLCSAVKRSTNAARASIRTPSQENCWLQSLGAGNAGVQSSSALFASDGCALYSAPYSRMCVQTARRLLPGQPLPQGVAAFAMATPATQQQ